MKQTRFKSRLNKKYVSIFNKKNLPQQFNLNLERKSGVPGGPDQLFSWWGGGEGGFPPVFPLEKTAIYRSAVQQELKPH